MFDIPIKGAENSWMAYSKGMGNLNVPAKTKLHRLVNENLFMAGKVNGSDLQEYILNGSFMTKISKNELVTKLCWWLIVDDRIFLFEKRSRSTNRRMLMTKTIGFSPTFKTCHQHTPSVPSLSGQF